MIALARVDLPDPLGPISAWISPLLTVRSKPLRICFSPACTCRLRISRSAAMSVFFWGAGSGRRDRAGGHDGGCGRRKRDAAGGEGDELGQRGLGERLDDAALD